MVKNFMTASQARTLTETSEKLLSVVFRSIKDAAEYGNNQLSFCVYEADDLVIDRITKTLIDAGYKITSETEVIDGVEKTINLKITW